LFLTNNYIAGKMLGGFSGKCSGSIKSIVRHPELPIVASCGERYSVLFHNIAFSFNYGEASLLHCLDP